MSGYRWGATTGNVRCCWCGKMLPAVLTVPVPHECVPVTRRTN